MRLCSISRDGGAPVLCSVSEDGGAHPVGHHRDVAELIFEGRADPLEDMVESAGVAREAIAHWDDLAEATSESARLTTPVRPHEVWAAGVTYERSRAARMHESAEPDIYERVYEAERPELFFKATGSRVVGPRDPVGLRSDSAWQVPEAEIALVLGRGGDIAGYTLGNDMSSRDIEGANPLYLPQAKIFAGSCALGPVVVSAREIRDPYNLDLALRVRRAERVVFEDETSTANLHVGLDALLDFLRRDNWLAPGTVLLTGTGIVPPDDFSLAAGDVIEISSAAIGTLVNHCAPAAELPAPAGWARRRGR